VSSDVNERLAEGTVERKETQNFELEKANASMLDSSHYLSLFTRRKKQAMTTGVGPVHRR
jgi:hypothetical protein